MRTHLRVFLVVAAVIAVNCLAAASAFADFVPTERFSGPGAGDGQLSDPQRAAVEQSSGDLFVVDAGNDRVQVFAPDGTKATYSAQFGSAQLDGPLGIATDQSDGSIYVSDADDVVKFDSAYAVVGSFTSPGVTGALAVDPTSGDLLVADRASDKVLRFNSDGSADGPGFDGSTSGTAFTDPIDIAVNSTGDIYVVDQTEDVDTGTGTSRVERFGAAGAHQASITPFGPNQQAARVAVNPDTDVLAVSGEQYAVNYNGDATVHLFDPSNAPINDTTTTSQYSKVAGMAFRNGTPDALFVVTDVSNYPCDCYGTPEIVAFEDVAPPSATIDPVTDIAEFTATFAGSVDPEGSATAYFFEYSTDGGSFWTATETQDLADTGTDPVPVTFAATGLPDDSAIEVRLVASKGGGLIRGESANESFSTLAATDPVASVGAPTDVKYFSGTLNGTIDPEGFAATPIFELSQDGGVSWFEAGEGTPSSVTGTDPVDVSLNVNFLSPATNYMVRLVARDPGGTRHTSANTESFTTLELAAPTVAVDPVTDMDADSAVLNGSIDGNELGVQYRFELSDNGGKSWDVVNPVYTGSGDLLSKFLSADPNPQSVSETAEGLDANKTYEVRIVATNQAGETVVGGQTFTTAPAPPGLRGTSAGGVEPTRAFLRAQVNGFGEATTYHFEYGKTTAYGSTAPAGGPTDLGVANQYLEVTELIKELEPATTYHFRFVAENVTGETVGPDRTFTTRAFVDSCPNAAVRYQQDAVRLPDCRAWEQVSESDKGGYPVNSPILSGISTFTPEGNRAIYTSWGAFVGTDHAMPQTYLADRTADGWVSRSVTPRSMDPIPSAVLGSNFVWLGASRALDRGILDSASSQDPTDVNKDRDVYSVSDTGGAELISRGNGSERSVVAGGPHISEDGTHSYFITTDHLVPEDAGRHPDPTGLGLLYDVYERSGGETRLVNLDSDEQLLNPCGSELAKGGLSQDEHPVSADGSRVFFMTPNESAIPGELGCDVVREVYMRVNAETTIQISRSRLDVPAPDAPARFLAAGADGSIVYFASQEKLTEDAPEAGTVYRYTTATDELEPTGIPVDDFRAVRISRDGSTFYYTLQGPPMRLFVYRDGESRLVADSGGKSWGVAGGDDDLTGRFSWISADGRRLGFMSRIDLSQGKIGDGRVGKPGQIYLYDWDRDRLACLTCVEGVSGAQIRDAATAQISEDGSTVAIQTPQRLTSDDSNSETDIYRWREGDGVEMVSGGRGALASRLVGLSLNGDSIFFNSEAGLVSTDRDGALDLYVARKDGGFLVEEEKVGCAGAACQPPPAGSPPSGPLGSANPKPNLKQKDCTGLLSRLSRATKKLRVLRQKSRSSSSKSLKQKVKSTDRRVKKLRRATTDCEVSR